MDRRVLLKGAAGSPATFGPAHENLSVVNLFAGLAEEEREAAARSCVWRWFQAGEQVIAQEDKTSDIYFIVRGRARAVIYSACGKTVAFREMGPGEFFGEFAAIDSQPRSAGIEALERCRIARMAQSDFQELLRAQPDISAALMVHFVAQIRSLTARVFEFSTLGVKNRIHAELLRLARGGLRDGNTATIAVFPTRAEIASRISTHREAVTREMSNLAKCGLVGKCGDGLRVNDIAQLERMVAEASGI